MTLKTDKKTHKKFKKNIIISLVNDYPIVINDCSRFNVKFCSLLALISIVHIIFKYKICYQKVIRRWFHIFVCPIQAT